MIERVNAPVVVGVDPAARASPVLVIVRYAHRRHVIADHLPDVALCVYGEIEERAPSTVEEWEVTFDLQLEEDLPADDPAHWWHPGPLSDDPRNVTCPACKEWMNA